MATFDILIQNGTVIDGSGEARQQVDVGVREGRIAAVGDLSDSDAVRIIDAQGLIVAPGFIDVHNHSDSWLLELAHLEEKTRQGFTTEIIMADGISYAPVNEATVHDWIFYLRCLNGLTLDKYQGWRSISDYMTLLDGATVQNAATHIPYANVRAMTCGFGRAAPDDYQMRIIQDIIAAEMDAGAVGLSTGLDYIAECFATTDELVAATSAIAPYNGLYVTHIRYKTGLLNAVKEAVEIGKRAGVAVHISHMKATTLAENEALLKYVNEVAVNEVDFSFDVYPYVPSSTMLNFLLPYEVWGDGSIAAMTHLAARDMRLRFARYLESQPLDAIRIAWLPGEDHREHIGKSLQQYSDDLNAPPADALCDLLIEQRLAVLLVFGNPQPDDDAILDALLSHPKYMMGTDGIYFADGRVHPRQYGSVGRFLGYYVREREITSWEDAVYKLSGCPAQRFGLKERGLLRAGYAADVVIFDAETIIDHATYADPHQFTSGVRDVMVNGVPVIDNGQRVDFESQSLPGRYLKRS